MFDSLCSHAPGSIEKDKNNVIKIISKSKPNQNSSFWENRTDAVPKFKKISNRYQINVWWAQKEGLLIFKNQV